MNVKIVLTIVAILASSQSMAGREGHGGDAVVCFNIPLSDALNEDGTMTQAGRESILSAEPVEVYLAKKIQDKRGKNPRAPLNRLAESNLEDSINGLHAYLKRVPVFYEKVEKTRDSVRPILEYGLPSPRGLIDVPDGGAAQVLEDGCEYIQAVVRRYSEMNYEPDVFVHYTPFEEAVHLFHERIYYIADHLKKMTSVSTQVLVSNILARVMTPAELAWELRETDFGHYDSIDDKVAHALQFNTLVKELEYRVDRLFEKMQELSKGPNYDPYSDSACRRRSSLQSEVFRAYEAVRDGVPLGAIDGIVRNLRIPVYELNDVFPLFAEGQDARREFDTIIAEFTSYLAGLREWQKEVKEGERI